MALSHGIGPDNMDIVINELDALANIDKTRFETKEEYEAEVERITKYYLDRDIYLRTELDKAG